jgi:hypothetical protein
MNITTTTTTVTIIIIIIIIIIKSPVISVSHLRTDNFGGSSPKPVCSEFLRSTKSRTQKVQERLQRQWTNSGAMKLNI